MHYYKQPVPIMQYRHIVVDISGIDTLLRVAHLYTPIHPIVKQVQNFTGMITVDASVDWELICFHHNVLFIMYHKL